MFALVSKVHSLVLAPLFFIIPLWICGPHMDVNTSFDSLYPCISKGPFHIPSLWIHEPLRDVHPCFLFLWFNLFAFFSLLLVEFYHLENFHSLFLVLIPCFFFILSTYSFVHFLTSCEHDFHFCVRFLELIKFLTYLLALPWTPLMPRIGCDVQVPWSTCSIDATPSWKCPTINYNYAHNISNQLIRN